MVVLFKLICSLPVGCLAAHGLLFRKDVRGTLGVLWMLDFESWVKREL